MTTDPTLKPGEVVRWSGRPDPRRVLTGSDVFLVPFSVLWGVVGLDLALDTQRGPQVATLVMVIVTGVFLVAGRFLVKAHRKRQTRYILTDARAIICGPSRTFSFDFDGRNPHVQVIGSQRHRTLKFTSDDPRSHGKFSAELIVNTGLDFLLRPGLDARFSFYDVPSTEALEAVVAEYAAAGKVAEGIA